MPIPSDDLAHLLANLLIASTDLLGRLPWLSDTDGPLELPFNIMHHTRLAHEAYSGINAVVLTAHARSVKFPRPIYATARQWMDCAQARINTRRTTHPAPVVYFMKTHKAAIAKLSEPVFNLTDVVPCTAWHAPVPQPSRPALPALRLATLAEQHLLQTEVMPHIARRFARQDTLARHLVCDLASALVAMQTRRAYAPETHHDALADGLIGLLKSDPRALFAIATQAQKTANAMHAALSQPSPPPAAPAAKLSVA